MKFGITDSAKREADERVAKELMSEQEYKDSLWDSESSFRGLIEKSDKRYGYATVEKVEGGIIITQLKLCTDVAQDVSDLKGCTIRLISRIHGEEIRQFQLDSLTWHGSNGLLSITKEIF